MRINKSFLWAGGVRRGDMTRRTCGEMTAKGFLATRRKLRRSLIVACEERRAGMISGDTATSDGKHCSCRNLIPGSSRSDRLDREKVIEPGQDRPHHQSYFNAGVLGRASRVTDSLGVMVQGLPSRASKRISSPSAYTQPRDPVGRMKWATPAYFANTCKLDGPARREPYTGSRKVNYQVRLLAGVFFKQSRNLLDSGGYRA